MDQSIIDQFVQFGKYGPMVRIKSVKERIKLWTSKFAEFLRSVVSTCIYFVRYIVPLRFLYRHIHCRVL